MNELDLLKLIGLVMHDVHLRVRFLFPSLNEFKVNDSVKLNNVILTFRQIDGDVVHDISISKLSVVHNDIFGFLKLCTGRLSKREDLALLC